MLMEIMKPDFEFKNDNGILKQLIHEGWRQVNVITSEKDCIRGGHYHKYNQEAFYIIKGKFELKLMKGKVTEHYVMKEGDMFNISPFTFHTFYYLEETLLISMYSKGVEMEDGSKDIWEDILSLEE